MKDYNNFLYVCYSMNLVLSVFFKRRKEKEKVTFCESIFPLDYDL